MASYAPFVAELHAQTGLDTKVLNAWASAENGVNNNILGVTSGGSLMKFSTQKQAADYTANLLKSSNYYSGIIASANQSVAAQAMAIAQSPWHLGPSGLAAQGGTDPYYMRIFRGAGIVTGGSASTTPSSSDPIGTAAGIVGNMTGVGGVVGAVQGAASGATDPVSQATAAIGNALATPVYFIGIILIGITVLIIGGFLVAKGPMEKAGQTAAPLMAAA